MYHKFGEKKSELHSKNISELYLEKISELQSEKKLLRKIKKM